MAQVKGKIKLIKHNIGWSFILIDPENLKQQAVEKFVRGSEAIRSIVLDMVIKAPHVEKTLSQLGYLHAAVWPVFYQYYEDQGQPAETEWQKETVRDEVKWAIGFVDVHKRQLIQPGHVEPNEYLHKPKSFADASKEETSEAIDSIIRLGAEFGMIVPSPEEYLEQHGVKDFES